MQKTLQSLPQHQDAYRGGCLLSAEANRPRHGTADEDESALYRVADWLGPFMTSKPSKTALLAHAAQAPAKPDLELAERVITSEASDPRHGNHEFREHLHRIALWLRLLIGRQTIPSGKPGITAAA